MFLQIRRNGCLLYKMMVAGVKTETPERFISLCFSKLLNDKVNKYPMNKNFLSCSGPKRMKGRKLGPFICLVIYRLYLVVSYIFTICVINL